jgi:FkbM family methyltransferase
MYSKAVGKDGLVLAIEPDFRAVGMLAHNVADLTNVKILPYALWFKEDVIPFQYMDSSGGVGMGSVVYQYPFWHPTRAITLDKLLEKLDIKEVNFIKMDIEGSELRALEGMSETLKRVEALAVAAYHRIDDKGTKSYKDVISMLEAKAFVTRLEQGLDGEMVYANRY